MDSTEPPRIVFESAGECADSDRAEVLLRQALEQARAPGPGWVVTMRVGAATPPAVSAEGDVADASGTSLAHNVLSGDAADCSGLARSLGAWASLVLQTETQRAHPADSANRTPQPPPQSPPQARSVPVVRAPAAVAPFVQSAASSETQAAGETQDYDMPTLELGMGAFLMVGGGAGGYVGVSPFLVDEVARGVFLRPSVALGDSLATNLSSIWAAARLDTCVRLPGRYASRNGIQLDLCGGPDVGFSYVAAGTQTGTPPTAKTLPYVDIGPSADLHGEVGNLAISMRGVVGIDVARAGFVDVTGAQVDVPMWSWRLELDFSWALRRSSK
jgi:hypothetical protein